MINSKIKILFLSTLFFLSGFYFSLATEDTGIDVNLQVGGCVVDGICGVGEDIFNCPSDCNPVIPPSHTGGSTAIGGILTGNYFNNLIVEVSYNSAIIRWTSFLPVTSNVSWGTNPDYKDGVLRNGTYLLEHKIVLDNLKDGTLYYFNIETENLLGKTNRLENQIFRTLFLPDNTPPMNPSNMKIESLPSGVMVSWQNPKDKDFDYVRVVRNLTEKKGYNNGQVVYEGSGVYLVDSKVKEGAQYFYSLFSRDRSGNYSSGIYVNIFHKSSNNNIFLFPPLTQIEDLSKGVPSPIKEYQDNVFYGLFWLLLLLLLIIIYLIWRKIRRKNKERE